MQKNRVMCKANLPGVLLLSFGKNLSLWGAVLGSLTAYGAPDEGLFRADELPEQHKIAELNRAVEATVKIEMLSGGTGSGFFISNSGYMLTALHVIDSLPEVIAELEQNQLTNPMTGAPVLDTDFSGDAISYRQWKMRFLSTPLALQNISIREAGRSANIQLVAVGRWEQLTTHSFFNLGNTSDYRHYDDYALLKIALPLEPKQAWPCLEVGSQDPAPSDPIWSIGNPGAAIRENGISSDGVSKYVTYGKTLPKEKAAQYEHTSLNEILGDQDLMFGMSGGPSINSKGQVVGINVRYETASVGSTVGLDFAEHARNNYIKNGSVVLSTRTVRQDILAMAGEEKTNDIFQCGKISQRPRLEAVDEAKAWVIPQQLVKVESMLARLAPAPQRKRSAEVETQQLAFVMNELLQRRAEFFEDYDGDGKQGFELTVSDEVYSELAKIVSTLVTSYGKKEGEHEKVIRSVKNNFGKQMTQTFKQTVVRILSESRNSVLWMSPESRAAYVRGTYTQATLEALLVSAVSVALGKINAQTDTRKGEKMVSSIQYGVDWAVERSLTLAIEAIWPKPFIEIFNTPFVKPVERTIDLNQLVMNR